MKNTNKTSAAATIQKLKLELAEKKAIIHAIQAGEIDALVMNNNLGEEKVLPLIGSDLPYQTLMESINEGTITFVSDGTIVYCNKKFSEMVKTPDEKVIGNKFTKFIQHPSFLTVKDLLKEFKKNYRRQIFTLIAKDKSTKNVYISCHLIEINSDHAYSLVITDITAIQQAEKRYSTLMENASCGFIIIDHNAIISEVNKQTETIFNLSKKEIIGNDLRNFVPEHERYLATNTLQRIIAEKGVEPLEGHIQRPNGEIRNIIFSAAEVLFDNENLILGVINDVTERKRLQSHALLSDKLATIGMLASGIIHEINNPMTWVMTNLTYVKEQLKNISSTNADDQKILAKLTEALEDSIQGGNKIKDIILNLKGFTRADDKKVAAVNINEAIESVIKMTSVQFKNITTIQKDFGKNIPYLKLNQNKLHQVLLNLIVNAAQAMNEDNVANNVIIVKTYCHENEVYIDIIDNGKGIPPEILKKIFNPFFTTKPKGIGTGLGLSLCTDIIHSLGGEITAKSIVGQGSTFTISLPLTLTMDPTIENKSGK